MKKGMPKVYAMVLNTYNVSQIRHGVTSSVVFVRLVHVLMPLSATNAYT